MSTALPVGMTSEEADGPVWSAAAARVRSYLEVAGLKSSAAAALAQEIVSGCGASSRASAEDEAILAALRIAGACSRNGHRATASMTAGVPLAPRDQPLSIRRRAFRSHDRLAFGHVPAAATPAGRSAAAGAAIPTATMPRAGG